MKIIKIHINKRSIPIGTNNIFSNKEGRINTGEFANKKFELIKVAFHCPDCGEPRVDKVRVDKGEGYHKNTNILCSRCSGKRLSEKYNL